MRSVLKNQKTGNDDFPKLVENDKEKKYLMSIQLELYLKIF